MKSKLFLISAAVILLSSSVWAATRSFTVLSPAGGEQWILGSTHAINAQFNGDTQLTGTDTVGIYLQGSSGLIKVGSVLYKPPFSWVVGKTITSFGGVGNTINTPLGQYTLKIVYPWDDTAGTSSSHAEGVSNTFQIVAATPVPTASSTPKATSTPSSGAPGPTGSVSAAACVDNASIISSDLPANIALAPGATKTFTVTVTNSGNTNWYDGAYYQLRNSASRNILSPTYGHLPNLVGAGEKTAWTFTIKASETAGSYPVSLQMAHLTGGQYIKSTGTKCAAPTKDTLFGQVFSSTIEVGMGSSTPVPPASGSNWFMDNLMLVGIGIAALLALALGAWWLMRPRPSAVQMPPPTIPPTSPMPPQK